MDERGAQGVCGVEGLHGKQETECELSASMELRTTESL